MKHCGRTLAQGACILLALVGFGQAVAAPAAAPVAPTSVKCRSELSPEALDRTAGRGPDVDQTPESSTQADPRQVLQAVARQALARSASVGASQWLTDAANFDLEQAQAGRWPSLVASASMGPQHSTVNDETTQGTSRSLGLSAGGTLWDFGRVQEQVQWRKDLLRAEQLGLQIAGESVVSEAVATVLDRSRYQMQAQVYQQYVRKMACLVDALEAIVAADRGRASELVQARKTLAQAELSRDIALSAGRQVDFKLRKLLGDTFVVPGSISGALATPPELGEVRRLMESSADLMQAQAEIQASESYARSADAGRWPQFGWSASNSLSRLGKDRANSWQANVSLSYTLFDAGLTKAAAQSAWARTEATRKQYAELVASRLERVTSLHDASNTSFKHARRYADILRDSELVRSYTFQQWSQLGRRSLFDLMSAESDHFNLRVAYVNALFDGYAANAQLRSLAGGLKPWILGEPQP